ncbi:MAG: ABC transporter ATP-binding protein [Inquilinaceae bacterium]
MAGLSLRRVCKSFGDVAVIQDVDLDVADGEFTVFVGPSGCGKSTLLRLICGLDEVTGGELLIDNEIVNDVPPAKRGIAMVFQSYALYPHMTVADNMGYALKLAAVPKPEIRERVEAAASILQLSPYLDRKPRQLSGGQRQRVAIGRAIVREPRIFLFDEPLSNLDAALRVDTRIEIARLKERLGATMIYVTHDQVEAMTLADKIVVLNAGRIEQVGTPLDLYSTPANRFVATFIGSPKMNILAVDGVSTDGSGPALRVAGGTIPCGAVETGAVTKIAEVGVRPEHLVIAGPDQTSSGLPGTVLMTEHLGSDTFAFFEVDGRDDPVLVRLAGERPLKRGETARIVLSDAGDVHLFASDGAAIRADADAPRSAA